MSDYELIEYEIDLTTPYGPEEAGADLDRVPLPILVSMVAQAHDQLHVECAFLRRHYKRRPWRWQRLRALREMEREKCVEVRRRRDLLVQVHRARHADGAADG